MNSYYLEKMAEEKMKQFEKDASNYRTVKHSAKNHLFSFIANLRSENKKHIAACCA
ncbi:hypothetical protein ACFFJY_16415 [Fictibacillus aquaticus]|uniref:hypothetical protein n=1 Tax=Fictibacillus aquaticus TaxID=2021314 RepID=UPI0013FE1423|nr:hypothetical protein [Fictibacillus aquaticus]